MSKYPDIGILDAIYRLAFGTGFKMPREKVYLNVAKRGNLDRIWFSKRVYYLKSMGFLKYGLGRELILTKNGVKRLDFNRFEKMKLGQKPKDGKWRVIIFDIPEKQRSARDLLRAKLNEFECYQLQKSVYATPYKCEKEIEEISSILNVGGRIHVIVADSLGMNETKVRNYFKM